jgi:serpin B
VTATDDRDPDRDRDLAAILRTDLVADAGGAPGDGASIAPDALAAVDEAKSNLARVPASSLPAGSADVAVIANNAFAPDLYSRVRAASASSSNLWTSPISASIALTMAYAGARGTTATEMAGALHFDPSATTLDAMTRMVIVNAVSLDLPWQQPFDSSETRPGTFTRGDGSTVTTDFMTQVLGAFPYVDDGQAQILTLPLATGDVQVNFALPHRDLATYERDLTAASALLHYNVNSTVVDVAVPKMTFTAATFSLAGALEGMGMKQAFDPSAANFTGLSANGGLFVKDVLQKASLELFENGVEAAAATVVVIATGAVAVPPPPFIQLNKPFVTSMVDRTGAVLFLGHVVDPTNAGSP